MILICLADVACIGNNGYSVDKHDSSPIGMFATAVSPGFDILNGLTSFEKRLNNISYLTFSKWTIIAPFINLLLNYHHHLFMKTIKYSELIHVTLEFESFLTAAIPFSIFVYRVTWNEVIVYSTVWILNSHGVTASHVGKKTAPQNNDSDNRFPIDIIGLINDF